MLTMTRTEAIPYDAMKDGMTVGLGDHPEYLDSLDRAPKGVNCIQYMPTASLMTYVMGLEAAKSRAGHRRRSARRCARLLDEGMDAGLVRLLDPAPRRGLASGRLRRLADGHRHHVRRGHPRPRRACCASATRASSRSPRRPATSSDDLAFVEAAGRDGAAADPVSTRSSPTRNDPEIHRRSLRWLERCRDKGLPIYGQGATVRSRLRLHAGALEPLRREPGVARDDDRHHRREDGQDARPRAARGGHSARPTTADRQLQARSRRRRRPIQQLIVQCVDDARSWRSTSASRSARSARKRASIRST